MQILKEFSILRIKGEKYFHKYTVKERRKIIWQWNYFAKENEACRPALTGCKDAWH